MAYRTGSGTYAIFAYDVVTKNGVAIMNPSKQEELRTAIKEARIRSRYMSSDQQQEDLLVEGILALIHSETVAARIDENMRHHGNIKKINGFIGKKVFRKRAEELETLKGE